MHVGESASFGATKVFRAAHLLWSSAYYGGNPARFQVQLSRTRSLNRSADGACRQADSDQSVRDASRHEIERPMQSDSVQPFLLLGGQCRFIVHNVPLVTTVPSVRGSTDFSKALRLAYLSPVGFVPTS